MFRFPIGVGNDDALCVGNEDVFWVGNDLGVGNVVVK